ncbi:hypothetical protein U27_00385 [Candidatus Vecturithrix granuli]|uniref:Uncharacterized protein n=1 Tax=Vecturithrix granuli TaxID=1499967 RepID=A0A081C7D3_VECG1|nr:hypothetical protein U27_00385 [Candidatus Vecturithrix granuli]
MIAQGVSPEGENPTCIPSPSCPRVHTLGYQISPRWGLKAYPELTLSTNNCFQFLAKPAKLAKY